MISERWEDMEYEKWNYQEFCNQYRLIQQQGEKENWNYDLSMLNAHELTDIDYFTMEILKRNTVGFNDTLFDGEIDDAIKIAFRIKVRIAQQSRMIKYLQKTKDFSDVRPFEY